METYELRYLGGRYRGRQEVGEDVGAVVVVGAGAR